MSSVDDDTAAATFRGSRSRGGGAAGALAGRRIDPAVVDLEAYRSAVADLLAELAGDVACATTAHVERIVADRLTESEFVQLLAATPRGTAGTVSDLRAEVRRYQPNHRSSAVDLFALVRIYLLSQIDAMWWGTVEQFATDATLLQSPDLVDLEPLRRGGRLAFRYRRQAVHLPARAVRAAERRWLPRRAPLTAGLRFTRTRPEAVVLLNRLAAEFANASPAGTPPLWVNSLARSTAHQQHLRNRWGYAAVPHSAHCVGYAMDIEMTWFRRFDADVALKAVLLMHHNAGMLNVIDEGQAWHAAINPSACPDLRGAFESEVVG